MYNEHNELFKDINNIKGIIIDENAIQQFENGFSQCVIIIDDDDATNTSTVAPPTSFLHKKITPHELLIDIFKQAYGIDDLNLTTSELKSLRVIHGDELIAAINATKVNFHIKTALKKHTQAQNKIRQNSDTPFVNKMDIYENVLRYLRASLKIAPIFPNL